MLKYDFLARYVLICEKTCVLIAMVGDPIAAPAGTAFKLAAGRRSDAQAGLGLEFKSVYSSPTAFLRDVEVLRAVQLEQASRERATRFTGRVIKTFTVGRLTPVVVWVEPSTLSRLVTFGLEVGGGVSICAAAGPPALGYVAQLDPEGGLLEVSLAAALRPPAPGALVHGEIHPLQFLVFQEAESLTRAVSSSPDAIKELLSRRHRAANEDQGSAFELTIDGHILRGTLLCPTESEPAK